MLPALWNSGCCPCGCDCGCLLHSLAGVESPALLILCCTTTSSHLRPHNHPLSLDFFGQGRALFSFFTHTQYIHLAQLEQHPDSHAVITSARARLALSGSASFPASATYTLSPRLGEHRTSHDPLLCRTRVTTSVYPLQSCQTERSNCFPPVTQAARPEFPQSRCRGSRLRG